MNAQGERAHPPVQKLRKRREVLAVQISGQQRQFRYGMDLYQRDFGGSWTWHLQRPGVVAVRWSVPAAVLTWPSEATDGQLAAVLWRWLMRQPEFCGAGVATAKAVSFLEALGWHALDEVLLTELHTGAPRYAQAGARLLPLPWTRFGEAAPEWAASPFKEATSPSLLYRFVAVQYWAERLTGADDVEGALSFEPDELVRNKVRGRLFLDGAGQTRAGMMLQRYAHHIPPPGGYLLLNCASGRFLLYQRAVPAGVVAKTLDGRSLWRWKDAALYLERPPLRVKPVYQGPKDMAELLDRLLDPAEALQFSLGPVGGQLLAELRAL